MVRNSRSSAPLPPPQADRSTTEIKIKIWESLLILPPRFDRYILPIPMIRQFQFSIKQKIPRIFQKKTDGGDDKTRRMAGPAHRRGDPLDLFGRFISFALPAGSVSGG